MSDVPFPLAITFALGICALLLRSARDANGRGMWKILTPAGWFIGGLLVAAFAVGVLSARNDARAAKLAYVRDAASYSRDSTAWAAQLNAVRMQLDTQAKSLANTQALATAESTRAISELQLAQARTNDLAAALAAARRDNDALRLAARRMDSASARERLVAAGLSLNQIVVGPTAYVLFRSPEFNWPAPSELNRETAAFRDWARANAGTPRILGDPPGPWEYLFRAERNLLLPGADTLGAMLGAIGSIDLNVPGLWRGTFFIGPAGELAPVSFRVDGDDADPRPQSKDRSRFDHIRTANGFDFVLRSTARMNAATVLKRLSDCREVLQVSYATRHRFRPEEAAQLFAHWQSKVPLALRVPVNEQADLWIEAKLRFVGGRLSAGDSTASGRWEIDGRPALVTPRWLPGG